MEQITVEPYRRFKITLDLSEIEILDLANAIYESTVNIDNWRSDPTLLHALHERLVAAQRPKAVEL